MMNLRIVRRSEPLTGQYGDCVVYTDTLQYCHPELENPEECLVGLGVNMSKAKYKWEWKDVPIVEGNPTNPEHGGGGNVARY